MDSKMPHTWLLLPGNVVTSSRVICPQSLQSALSGVWTELLTLPLCSKSPLASPTQHPLDGALPAFSEEVMGWVWARPAWGSEG